MSTKLIEASIEDLTMFLRDEDCEEKFWDNFQEIAGVDLFKEYCPTLWITGSFVFNQTKEGHSYWWPIHEKWNCKLKGEVYE